MGLPKAKTERLLADLDVMAEHWSKQEKLARERAARRGVLFREEVRERSGPVVGLSAMSPEKRAEMERLYGRRR